jgi:hypothetical protein
VDANRGLLFAELSPEVGRFYAREKGRCCARKAILKANASSPGITRME